MARRSSHFVMLFSFSPSLPARFDAASSQFRPDVVLCDHGNASCRGWHRRRRLAWAGSERYRRQGGPSRLPIMTRGTLGTAAAAVSALQGTQWEATEEQRRSRHPRAALATPSSAALFTRQRRRHQAAGAAAGGAAAASTFPHPLLTTFVPVEGAGAGAATAAVTARSAQLALLLPQPQRRPPFPAASARRVLPATLLSRAF